MANSLGIEHYLSFSVASPFNYEENMAIYMPKFPENDLLAKMKYVHEQMEKTNGRALVLFTNKTELASFKQYLHGKTTLPVYFEGDAEISKLVSHFQNEEQSVLCAVHLWEGLDIPGRALENVFLFSLPFPPNDPVFTAKHESVADPFKDIDLPYMILRLRQGIGRLIRTHEDKGNIHILLKENEQTEVIELVKNVLPTCEVAIR